MAVRNFSLLRPELGLKSLSDGIRTPCGITVSHQKNSEDCRLKSVADGSTRFLLFSPKIFHLFWWRCCQALPQRSLSQPLVGPELGDVERLWAPKPGSLAKDGPFHRLVPGGTPQRFLEVGNVRNIWCSFFVRYSNVGTCNSCNFS